jgi:hypothetical protein
MKYIKLNSAPAACLLQLPPINKQTVPVTASQYLWALPAGTVSAVGQIFIKFALTRCCAKCCCAEIHGNLTNEVVLDAK